MFPQILFLGTGGIRHKIPNRGIPAIDASVQSDSAVFRKFGAFLPRTKNCLVMKVSWACVHYLVPGTCCLSTVLIVLDPSESYRTLSYLAS